MTKIVANENGGVKASEFAWQGQISLINQWLVSEIRFLP